jgi:hypothetical protein
MEGEGIVRLLCYPLRLSSARSIGARRATIQGRQGESRFAIWVPFRAASRRLHVLGWGIGCRNSERNTQRIEVGSNGAEGGGWKGGERVTKHML